MLEEFGLISKEIFIILIFLIPGYVGLRTLLWFLIVLFPAFKYRYDAIKPISVIIISLLWSSIIFFISLKISDINQMIIDPNIRLTLILIAFSVGIAELLSIGIWLVILSTMLISTTLGFLIPHDQLNLRYFSWVRWRMIWKQIRYRNFLSDQLYLYIIKAYENHQKIKVYSRYHKEVVGRIYGLNKLLENSRLCPIKDDRGNLLIIKLEDITCIQLLNS